MSLPAMDETTALMRSIIGRIATGPELSKDISREEACQGMSAILNNKVDEVQAAIFLIALRTKRETDDEFLGVLDAVQDFTETVTADTDEVLNLVDPYDGFNRTMPSSPFLAPVLATLGVPTYSQGVEDMGPKHGVTHKKVLAALGIDTDLDVSSAAARLADSNIGWAYLDQSTFSPALQSLHNLRTRIVKRPVLTTVEVLASPIRGKAKTHFLTGYVHKPYPRIYAMLARAAGYDSALLIRGVEGGVVPSLRQEGKYFYYHDKGEEQPVAVDPNKLGINQDVRAAGVPDEFTQTGPDGDVVTGSIDSDAVAAAVAEAGKRALSGEAGPLHDGLVYSGAICLKHLGRVDSLEQGADRVRELLASGAALDRLK